MIVSWYASAQYQKAQFAKIPPTIIEVPVEVIVPGEAVISGEDEIAYLKKTIAEMTAANEKEELQKKEPKEETEMVFSWEDYIDFVSEFEPDMGEVINIVYREKSIVDSCIYSYQDKINDYSVDFNVRYESKVKDFFFKPHVPVFSKEKPVKWKRTTISVAYFANDAKIGIVQYDVFKFLNAGGLVGWWKDDPLVGVCLGFKF